MAALHLAASVRLPKLFGLRWRSRSFVLLATVMTVGGCTREGTVGARDSVFRGASGGLQVYGLGRRPTAAQIASIDIDANPAGAGLPQGHGTAAEGSALYAAKCAMCHGARGQGQGPYPKLIGRVPAAGFTFAADGAAPKTIGNYWPYATTVYDYVHRAMPFNAPGSLTPNETYSLVAYLLSENGVVTPGSVLDATTLPRVKMPARAYFVPDNRTGGRQFR